MSAKSEGNGVTWKQVYGQNGDMRQGLHRRRKCCGDDHYEKICKYANRCESEGLSNIPVQSPELFIHEVIKIFI